MIVDVYIFRFLFYSTPVPVLYDVVLLVYESKITFNLLQKYTSSMLKAVRKTVGKRFPRTHLLVILVSALNLLTLQTIVLQIG